MAKPHFKVSSQISGFEHQTLNWRTLKRGSTV